MSHVRTQIRLATAAALSSVGEVSVSRVYPISAAAELPILLVSTDDEQIEGKTHAGYQRSLDLVVEVVTKGEFVDDDLDALISAIETAINRSTLGGLCKPLMLTEIRLTFDVGSTPIGRARMTYRAIYFTDFNNPETAV